jgi:di/tricarboxylate transporter
MRTAAKIVLAGVVGTTFMTLYSYIISKKEKQEFTEPILLNKLIDGSENLPDIADEDKHPAGWLAHYGIGVLFVIAYWIVWRRALRSPGIVKGLLIGAASGIVAIISWKLMFAANDDPPQNDRYKYYRQLFYAHLIFSVFALFGYKLPEYVKRIS